MYICLSIIITAVGAVMIFNPKLFLILRKAGKAAPEANHLTFTFSLHGWAVFCVC